MALLHSAFYWKDTQNVVECEEDTNNKWLALKKRHCFRWQVNYFFLRELTFNKNHFNLCLLGLFCLKVTETWLRFKWAQKGVHWPHYLGKPELTCLAAGTAQSRSSKIRRLHSSPCFTKPGVGSISGQALPTRQQKRPALFVGLRCTGSWHSNKKESLFFNISNKNPSKSFGWPGFGHVTFPGWGNQVRNWPHSWDVTVPRAKDVGLAPPKPPGFRLRKVNVSLITSTPWLPSVHICTIPPSGPGWWNANTPLQKNCSHLPSTATTLRLTQFLLSALIPGSRSYGAFLGWV